MVLALGSTAFAKQIKWRMGSTWTPAINLYVGDKAMIKAVKEMSGGDFEIKWFPAGSLMKAFEWFDGCSKGVVEMAADWPSYWTGKDPAFDFLGSFPFLIDVSRQNRQCLVGFHKLLCAFFDTVLQFNLLSYQLCFRMLLCGNIPYDHHTHWLLMPDCLRCGDVHGQGMAGFSD